VRILIKLNLPTLEWYAVNLKKLMGLEEQLEQMILALLMDSLRMGWHMVT
jgi:hypothetical protein